MSIVRYTDKKTGQVKLYESTSHYDPVTKQSRPSRKYLGIEDPITKELIPSSGKPGRKKSSERKNVDKPRTAIGPDYRMLYENMKKERDEQAAKIRELKRKNKLLVCNLERMRSMTADMLSIVDSISES